jgi:hypothetical protein
MALPIIPHESFGADCCGCLYEVIEESGPKFVCNECGAVVSKEDVARIVMEMDSTGETCPHCGRLNRIEGFSRIYAFTCQYCGRGVGL